MQDINLTVAKLCYVHTWVHVGMAVYTLHAEG